MEIVISISVLGGLGLLLGIVIGLCNKFFKVDENDIIDHIYELLPQINCGICGNPGCKKMAEDIARNGAKIDLCKPCKLENKQIIQQIIDDFEENLEEET